MAQPVSEVSISSESDSDSTESDSLEMSAEAGHSSLIDITVKTLDGQNRTFGVPESLTVRQFKEKISGSIDVPADSQRLIFHGRVMQDDKVLRDYDVHGKVIHLVQRAPPTSGAGSTAPSSTTSSAATSGRRPMQDGNLFDVQIHLGRVPNTPTSREARSRVRQADFNLGIIQNILRQLEILDQTSGTTQDDSSKTSAASTLAGSASGSNTSTPAGQGQKTEDSSRQSQQESSSAGAEGGADRQLGLTAVELASYMDQVLETNDRTVALMRRYQDILRREEPYPTNSREALNAQEVVNRASEVFHALSHMLHSLSDITVDVSSPAPRQAVATPHVHMSGPASMAIPIHMNVRTRPDRMRQRSDQNAPTGASTTSGAPTSTGAATSGTIPAGATTIGGASGPQSSNVFGVSGSAAVTTTTSSGGAPVLNAFTLHPFTASSTQGGTQSGDSAVMVEVYPTSVTVHDIRAVVTQGGMEVDSEPGTDSADTAGGNRAEITVTSATAIEIPSEASSMDQSAPSMMASSQPVPHAADSISTSAPSSASASAPTTSSSAFTFVPGTNLGVGSVNFAPGQLPNLPGLPAGFLQNILGSILNSQVVQTGHPVQVNVVHQLATSAPPTSQQPQQQIRDPFANINRATAENIVPSSSGLSPMVDVSQQTFRDVSTAHGATNTTSQEPASTANASTNTHFSSNIGTNTQFNPSIGINTQNSSFNTSSNSIGTNTQVNVPSASSNTIGVNTQFSSSVGINTQISSTNTASSSIGTNTSISATAGTNTTLGNSVGTNTSFSSTEGTNTTLGNSVGTNTPGTTNSFFTSFRFPGRNSQSSGVDSGARANAEVRGTVRASNFPGSPHLHSHHPHGLARSPTAAPTRAPVPQQMMSGSVRPGAGYVDPYLPCTSPHYTTQTAQAAFSALQEQQARMQQQMRGQHQAGEQQTQQPVPNLGTLLSGIFGQMGQAAQDANSGAARSGPAFGMAQPIPTQGLAGSVPGVPPNFNPQLEQMMQHLRGGATGAETTGQTGSLTPDFASALSSVVQAAQSAAVAAAIGSAPGLGSAPPGQQGITLADIFSQIRTARPAGTGNSEDMGVVSSILLHLTPFITVSDMIAMALGNFQVLNRIRTPLRDFVSSLVERHGGVEQTASAAVADIHPDLVQLQSSIQVRQGVDWVASVKKCLQHHLQILLAASISDGSGSEGDFGSYLYGLWVKMLSELIGLCVYCLQDGHPGFSRMVQSYVAQVTQGANAGIIGWINFAMQSLLGSFHMNHPVPESEILRFVVARTDSVQQASPRVEPQEQIPATTVTVTTTSTSTPPVSSVELPVTNTASAAPLASGTETSRLPVARHSLSSVEKPRPAQQVAQDRSVHQRTATATEAGTKQPIVKPTTLETRVVHSAGTAGNRQESDDWKSVVPQEWIPIITQDMTRQQEQKPQPPFSDAYLHFLPAKRRRIMSLDHSHEMSNMTHYLPDSLRRAAKTAGAEIVSSEDNLAQEAVSDQDLQAELDREIKLLLASRIRSDSDFSSTRFPQAEKYFYKYKQQ